MATLILLGPLLVSVDSDYSLFELWLSASIVDFIHFLLHAIRFVFILHVRLAVSRSVVIIICVCLIYAGYLTFRRD